MVVVVVLNVARQIKVIIMGRLFSCSNSSNFLSQPPRLETDDVIMGRPSNRPSHRVYLVLSASCSVCLCSPPTPCELSPPSWGPGAPLETLLTLSAAAAGALMTLSFHHTAIEIRHGRLLAYITIKKWWSLVFCCVVVVVYFNTLFQLNNKENKSAEAHLKHVLILEGIAWRPRRAVKKGS